MKQTVENYLREFSRRSMADMCQNMKVHEATLLMSHISNARRIRNGSETGIQAFNAWANQRTKAVAIMTRHFGPLATFCASTDGQALQGIHCHRQGNAAEMIINVPGEATR